MTDKRDGGAAFPGTRPVGYPDHDAGMSLRDWFAGQIISGGLANPAIVNRLSERTLVQAARDIYEFADALLSAREGG
jgi:hypothetical protein